jgi:hypothetical protein
LLKDEVGFHLRILTLLLMQITAAQKVEKASTSTNAWVLTSTLPEKYRTKTILSPPKIPTSTEESAYIALYTFIVTLIYLSGGKLPESKLEIYLQRVNADQSTPIDKTEKLKARLIREGYIVKIKDGSSGEDLVEYMVGPRGKVEIGEDGVGGMVRSVYGNSGGDDLEDRLERSLNFGRRPEPAAGGGAAAGAAAKSGKKRRRPHRDAEGNEEEEDNGEVTEDDDSDEGL